MAGILAAVGQQSGDPPPDPAMAPATQTLHALVTGGRYLGEVYPLGFYEALVQNGVRADRRGACPGGRFP